MIEHIVLLMTDPFGNYLCQKVGSTMYLGFGADAICLRAWYTDVAWYL